jgi:cytidylate kinase
MDNKKPLVIAIDGPAASGKSTLGLALARRLGLKLVDSGSMYRAVTLLALERDVVLHNERALAAIAESVSDDYRIDISGDSPRMWIGDREITQEIRSPEVGEAVSPVSAMGAVRAVLVDLQRSMVTGRGAVVEGRDIGNTVFPNAPLKVFLDASPKERTRRRYKELKKKGAHTTRKDVAEEIAGRDFMDSGRDLSPLFIPEDAVQLDTTDMNIKQVVDTIIEELKTRNLIGIRATR